MKLDIMNNTNSSENVADTIEVVVKKWKHTDKYPCPKCGEKLGMPSYACSTCNIKLKLKMNF